MSDHSQHDIRAQYDDVTITMYYACSAVVADAAVAQQKLSAHPSFKLTRTAWVRPSWGCTLQRSGYAYKDAEQERILALRMRHADFIEMLRGAILSNAPHERGQKVIVQWDYERGIGLEKYKYKCLQIGIPGVLVADWTVKIAAIADVTNYARGLSYLLTKDFEVTIDDLVDRDLAPDERLYKVPQDIKESLDVD